MNKGVCACEHKVRAGEKKVREMTKSLECVDGILPNVASMGEKIKKCEAEVAQKKIELKEAAVHYQSFKDMVVEIQNSRSEMESKTYELNIAHGQVEALKDQAVKLKEANKSPFGQRGQRPKRAQRGRLLMMSRRIHRQKWRSTSTARCWHSRA